MSLEERDEREKEILIPLYPSSSLTFVGFKEWREENGARRFKLTRLIVGTGSDLAGDFRQVRPNKDNQQPWTHYRSATNNPYYPAYSHTPPTMNDTLNPHKRVVLLLDMDCFYAQCEIVRLNIPRDVPLALMQWNSSLAVNYPARDKFQIKRGDNFETIANKSRGECVTIHLPVTPVVDDGNGSSVVSGKAIIAAGDALKEGMVDNDDCKLEEIGEGVIEEEGEAGDESAIKIAYDKEFNQSQHIREQMYKMEKNKMRYPSEGKANLDRYRLASSRIFSLIYEVCSFVDCC